MLGTSWPGPGPATTVPTAVRALPGPPAPTGLVSRPGARRRTGSKAAGGWRGRRCAGRETGHDITAGGHPAVAGTRGRRSRFATQEVPGHNVSFIPRRSRTRGGVTPDPTSNKGDAHVVQEASEEEGASQERGEPRQASAVLSPFALRRSSLRAPAGREACGPHA